MLKSREMYEHFKDLRMDNYSVSVNTLVKQLPPFNNIDYKPVYQRPYVWSEIKGTSYCESIIIGTEIPNKIFWVEEYDELIDGRQRYETLTKFVNNKFALNEKGLYILKDLKGKKFKDLDEEIKNMFLDTMIKILMIIPEHICDLSEYEKDQIKKTIFRRYNMGITPLKEVEIARAKYINNDITQYFINQFKKDSSTFEKTVSLLTTVKNKTFYDMVEIIMNKVRLLLIAHKIKSDYFVHSEGKAYAKLIFENTEINNKQIYENFVRKINILYVIKSHFDLHKFPHHISLYETLYWSLSILENENISLEKCLEEKFCSKLVNFTIKNKGLILWDETGSISQYTINKLRYQKIGKFFENYFKIDFDSYIITTREYQKQVKLHKKELTKNTVINDIKKLRLKNSRITYLPVSEVINIIRQEKMLLRPAYQRSECLDKTKSSAIIESMLMSFKLLPIFIFVRKNGVKEVVDGQQRLLAIIGFLGEKYKNEDGIFIESKKDKFKLQDLKIMENLNGMDFQSLPNDNKTILLHNVISFVEIYEEENEKFNPVDLFIRLNNRPYPIKNDSFEMWNTILPNDLLIYIKENTEKYKNWFYIKKNDKRMINEELYSIILFLESKKNVNNDINKKYIMHYEKDSYTTLRLTSKSNISNFMYQIAEKNDFEEIKEGTEKYIEKLKTLLSEEDNCDDKLLEIELNKLTYISKKRKQRSKTLIFALWYFLSPIDLSVIKLKKSEIKKDIEQLINYLCLNVINIGKYENFKKALNNFNQKYSSIYINKSKNIKTKKLKTNAKKPNSVKPKAILQNDKETTIVNVSVNVQGGSAKITN